MPILRSNTYYIFAPKRSRGKTFMLSVSVVLAVLFVLCAATSAWVGWNLTHPKHQAIVHTPSEVQLPFTDIQFPSAHSDHLQLSGWLIKPENANDKLVIFAHGYAGNRTGDEPVLPVAKMLYEQGISTMLFDFRGSGNSPGKLVTVGEFEKEDLFGAVDYAKQHGFHTIGLMGFSMGGVSSLLAASESGDVKCVIADSPFADLRSYLTDNMSHWTHLPNFPFTPLVLWEVPLITGINPAMDSPLQEAQGLTHKPVLLIHGTGDDTIPLFNSEEILKASQLPDSDLWKVAGAGHVQSYKFQKDEYLKRVLQFFASNLK